MSHAAELDELMHAARRRVIHLYLFVVGSMALISLQLAHPTEWSPEYTQNVALWGVGCLVVAALGARWLRRRIAATHRLAALVRHHRCWVERIKTTSYSFNDALCVGLEIDVWLQSGERLSFGFHRRATANRFIAAMQLHGLRSPPVMTM